jgi:glucose/mannose transport system substrate-binding protein
MKKILLFGLLMANITANATSLEVLHWWTAPGEIASLKLLENNLKEKGIEWKNFAVVGGGGDSAMRVLQIRAFAGNPPDVAQIKGPDIGEWEKVGVLSPLKNIVDTSRWHTLFPQVVQDTVTFNNQYMAVPINIHRVNWLWINTKIFNQLNLDIPVTWDEFFDTADKIKAAGYLPLAHGSTPWQDTLLFDSMALSLLGPEKYIQAFVERDNAVLDSPEMVAVFKKFKRLHDYVDKSLVGEDWYVASKLIETDKAAMQFMGDWAKGVWHQDGKIAMTDYICADVPESSGLFSYNIDSFVLFKRQDNNQKEIQKAFVDTLLSKSFQREFNINKGSIPVRNDMDMTQFDVCAQKSYYDFNHSRLVPSFTQNMAITSHLRNIIVEIISNYFNHPNANAKQAVKHLSTAIRALK